MPNQDVEFFQSFCRNYINKGVKRYFKDVSINSNDSLGSGTARQIIKRLCIHKDSDPITLTIGRLLVWWIEAKGLFNDIIYGIPSLDFEITNTYYPQVKLHFREDRYEASTNERRPARGEVSFRWRNTDYSTIKINSLASKLVKSFAKPVFSYHRGRELWTYVDKSKGYYFQMTVTSESEAKKVISQVIGVQDSEAPNWDEYLRKHEDQKNYNTQETVQVMGKAIKKPKRRPVARVQFAYAELFIPGTTQPKILVDLTGTKASAIEYV